MTKPTLYEIAVHTAREFGISKEDLLCRKKTYVLSHPRQIGMFLSTCHGFSTTQTGRFYKRDHTSVIFARNAVTKRMSLDLDLRLRIVKIDSNAMLAAEKRLALAAATWVGTGLKGLDSRVPSISVSIGGISEIPFEPSYRL